jgi:hypothetical protein
LNSRRLSSLFSSLSFATYFAGSEYITRGSGSLSPSTQVRYWASYHRPTRNAK